MEYAIALEGSVFGPNGRLPLDAARVAAYNERCERNELELLQQHPERIFMYVKDISMDCAGWQITTFLGTKVSERCFVGPRRYVGFGNSYRRSVDCVIAGQRYVGWYMESSGDYCRLRKAK